GNGNETSGNSSVGGGNQVHAPVSAPVNVCGNSAAVLGEAVAGCKGGAKVVNEGDGNGGLETSGDHSVLGGNQVDAPVSAPVNVCGNAVGHAAAGCEGGSETHNHGTMDPSGDGSIAGGNQVHAPVSVPVNACGNAAAVLGDSAALCEGGASTDSSIPGGMYTSGDHSVAGGNQVYAPITAPITACGNAVAVAAETAAGCVGGSHAEGTGAPHIKTSHGNQVVAPVKAPVEACGTNAQCQTDEEGHSRTSGPADLGLPTAPGLTRVLPIDGGLPVMPRLPAGAANPGLLPALPALGNVDTVSRSLQMRDTGGGLPVGDLSGLLPGGSLTQGLPAEGLPTDGLPMRSANGPLGGLTGSLPIGALPELPVGGNVPALESLPVGGHLKAPQTGGSVTDLTDAVNASAETPDRTGSVAVLVLGGILAAISVVGAYARRVVRR
ncbi:MAG: chaplin family protein, partial [Streptosporangiaceae bacterium]